MVYGYTFKMLISIYTHVGMGQNLLLPYDWRNTHPAVPSMT